MAADVVGWRIVKQQHAANAFSGDGARLYSGRWNSAGVPVVYCSESPALAALEILVHAQPAVLREKWRVFRVSWSEAIMMAIELKKLPKGWNAQPPGTASQRVGDEWVRSGRSAVLALPSVVIPLERTFLLNPRHRDFRKIKIKPAGEILLDSRLRR